MEKLNRNRPHTECVGDSLARWRQDGKYFDADGNFVPDEVAGLPSDQGQAYMDAQLSAQAEAARQAEDETRKRIEESAEQARLKAEAEAKAKAESGDEKSIVEIIQDLQDEIELKETLEAASPQILKKTLEELEVEPATGEGSTKKNIEKILEIWKAAQESSDEE